MAISICLELPYPPSVNHYWRYVGARPIISRKGREYRKTVTDLLSLRKTNPLEGPLEINICVNPPDKRRRDIDNIQKALLDALGHGGIYDDDSQIVKLSIEKKEPIKGGKTHVMIWELGGYEKPGELFPE